MILFIEDKQQADQFKLDLLKTLFHMRCTNKDCPHLNEDISYRVDLFIWDESRTYFNSLKIESNIRFSEKMCCDHFKDRLSFAFGQEIYKARERIKNPLPKNKIGVNFY